MPGEEKESHSERISDSARVLARMGHGISIRCFGTAVNNVYRRGNQLLREFARWSDIPVINMEDDVYHPCQGMADLLTLKEKFGSLKGRRFVMSWAYAPDHFKPVSVAHSALSLTSRYGMDIVLAHPEGFELDHEIIEQTRANAQASGGSLKITNDMADAVTAADVIYAKSWSSLRHLPPAMETVDEAGLAALFDANRKGWTANEEIMKRANPDAIYMHCLPCNRGFEVTDEVADGPQSAIFDQAENRLHAQKAIMAMTMR
jgi:N-acetylornithine carbamoyltransferase